MIAFSSPIQAVDRWYENGGILIENTNISLVGSKLHALANDHVARGLGSRYAWYLCEFLRFRDQHRRLWDRWIWATKTISLQQEI
jgi:hypothetical protein